MAVTLAQAAVLSQNELQRGVIETFVQNSKILEMLPFMSIEGNAFAYNTELALPGIAFRDVNTPYSESTGTFNQATETLKILGGEAYVDTFIQQTRSNLNDQRAEQTALKVKALAYQFQDSFINADSAVVTSGWDGLKKRLTGGQVIAAGNNGLGVIGDGSNTALHAWWDAIDQLISLVPGGPDVICANANIIAKMKSNARRLTIYDQTIDAFGKAIQTYNGIPLIDLGKNAAGTMILPQTETQGSSNVASSVYAIRFGQTPGDRGVTGLTNGGVQVKDMGELQATPAWGTRIEFFCGLAVFGGQAAARLTGALNS